MSDWTYIIRARNKTSQEKYGIKIKKITNEL